MILPSLILALAPVLIQAPSGLAYRQPQMASEGNTVYLTFGSGNEIYFAKSVDAGRSFSSPQRVAQFSKLFLGRHRGPRIVHTAEGLIITAIVVGTSPSADGDLLSWRSENDGKTWSPPVKVNDSPSASEEGLQGLGANANGLVFASWLDHRALKAKTPGAGPELYGAYSNDGGRTWSKNVRVYQSPSHSICSCCHPNSLVTADGKIYVMFRNDLDGNRDEYVTESNNGGKTFAPPQKLGKGAWKLQACPMDGGGLALGNQGDLVSVFRRQSTIYSTVNFQPEQQLGTGKDAALALGRDGAYFVWTSQSGLVLKTPESRTTQLLDASGGFGALVPLAEGSVIAAWESPHGIQVERISDSRRASR